MLIHKKIKRFAKQMQIEMEHNQHKGGIWDWNGINEKISDLEYHKAKMLMAMRANDKQSLKEYIADCANVLMAIGNECGLYDKPTKDDKKMSVLENHFIKRVEHKVESTKPFYTEIIKKETLQDYATSHY